MFVEDLDLVHRNDIEFDVFDYHCLDLLGERFGAFTVVHQTIDTTGAAYSLRCSCGVSLLQSIENLHEQRLWRCEFCERNAEFALQKALRRSLKKLRVGRVRILGILRGAIQRCHNPDCDAYGNYGARGIEVCEEWRQDPYSFYLWSLGNGYEDHLTLDRRDNYSGYEPTNCRWITNAENQRNRRVHQDRRGGTPA